MPISRAWYVSCDGCGDPAEVSTDSVAEARAIAVREGFYERTVAGGRKLWLCRLCKRAADRSGQRGS